MSDKTVTPDAISPQTGAARKIGDDAQKNAAERVREGTPARVHPIIEREEEAEKPSGPKSPRS
ncbi:MAG TPA: hypothetical protein VGG10_18055 [Rhizomicrobium sp.]|jgi:hypothetical protein